MAVELGLRLLPLLLTAIIVLAAFTNAEGQCDEFCQIADCNHPKSKKLCPDQCAVNECITNGGSSPNVPCVFPFKYSGTIYTECTTTDNNVPWCATEVNTDEDYVNWGNCGPGCPGIGLYEFLHQGHCAKGWKGPNTNQAKIEDCRNECAKRLNVGYFAYRTGNSCACYLADDKCPDDDKHDDYNAYRIVREVSANSSYMAVRGNYACAKSGAPCGTEQLCTKHSETTSNAIEVAVTCCDDASTGSRPGCISGVDFKTALTHCKNLGLRLCTAEEIKAGSGEATGCSFDVKLTWTSTSCVLEE